MSPAQAGSRPFWVMRRAEARGHAVILAGVLWIGAAVLYLGSPGALDMFGRLKGPDFVHFYTLGRVALLGEPDLLYDRRALHEFQTAIVPDGAPERFEPVYPPQTAVLFASIAWMPYGAALLAWTLFTAAIYALAVFLAWRRWRGALPDRVLVVAAAAGFPPFWNLILHGQTTAVPLLAFLLGWLALERRRPFWAGCALSLLALKPQLGLVLAAIVIAGGEWRMLAGALAGSAAQVLVVWGALGAGVIAAYAEVLRNLPRLADLLEPRPYQLHSIKAVTRLLPGAADTSIWLLVSAIVVWQTIRVWRSGEPVAVRIAVVVLASVLVSPHLTIYDATLLALPLLLLGGWVESAGHERAAAQYWPAVYWLFVAFLVPVALVTKVQVSVFLLCWVFAIAVRRSRPDRSAPTRR